MPPPVMWAIEWISAASYVGMLAQLPTIASGVFKSAVDYAAEHSLRDALAYELQVSTRNRGTEDAAEGRRSFHEKRKAFYKGR